MAEWKECLLGDLITFQRGHDLPKSKMSGNGYPVVGSNGIIGFHNEYTTEYPSITVGRSGNVGKPYIVYGRSWSHNTSLYIKEFKGTDPVFIYYFLQTLDLGNYAGGSAVPTLNRNHIHSLNVRVPADVSTQEKIANTLKALDDKIDKNTDINKNLFQQAQSIYSAWFEQFLLYNGKMPSNWHIGTIRDIADITTNNFNPQKNPGVMLEHYSIPAFDEQHFPVFELSDNVKSNKYILTNNSVLASKLNPDTKRVWRPMCLSENAVCSTEFIVFESKNPEHKDFLFSIIDSQPFSDWMCAHTTGSTNSRQRTTPSTTLDFKIAVPPDDVVDEFCSTVAPMYDLISQKLLENQRFSSLRDQLLPKLMTGEIDVSDIEL